MVILVVHGFAYRFSNDGVMESCPVEVTEDGVRFDGEWANYNLDVLDLTPGDHEEIRRELRYLTDLFVTDLPRREPLARIYGKEKI